MGAKVSYCTCRCFQWTRLPQDEQEEQDLIVVMPAAISPHDLSYSEDCLGAGIELQYLQSADAEIISQIDTAAALFETMLRESYTDLELILDLANCKVYAKDTARGFLMRSEWTCNHSPAHVRKFIGDLEVRRQWDKHIESVDCVKKVGENVGIYYQKYKRIFPMAQRDLLFANKSYQSEEKLIDVSCSVSLPEYPETPSIVRAQVYLGGYSMQPAPGSNGTHISCISELNFGGAVPKMIVKKVSAIAVPTFIRDIDTAISRDLEKQ